MNHYEQILSKTLPQDNDKIAMIAKENLMNIGARFSNDRTRTANKDPGISQTE